MERDNNKEKGRRETIIAQAALTGMSFNPDSDTDNDGINDFLEIAKHGLNAEIQKEKLNLDRQKFENDKVTNEKKLKLEEEKLKVAKKKSKST